MKRKLVTITLSASLVMTALAIPAYTEAFAASPKTESIEARASGNFQRLAKLSQKPQLNEEEVQFVISLNAVYGSLPAKEKPLVTQIMRRMPQMQVANYHKALEKKNRAASADEQRLLQLVNELRAKNGLNPLELSPILSEAAELRAKETGIAAKDALTLQAFENLEAQGWKPHSRLDGREVETVLEDVGLGEYVVYTHIYENLETMFAKPSTYLLTVDQAFYDWLNSPGHRAAMLLPDIKYMGLGYDGTYNQHWAQLFSE